MTPQDRAKQLATEHWNGYIKGLLEAYGGDHGINLSRIHSYNYITAFCHGYKHAVEDFENTYFGPAVGDVFPIDEVAFEAELDRSCGDPGFDLIHRNRTETRLTKCPNCYDNEKCGGTMMNGKGECLHHRPKVRIGGIGKITNNKALCDTCARPDCAKGQYPATKDGGCEGYIMVAHLDPYHANMEATKRDFCPNCRDYKQCAGTMINPDGKCTQFRDKRNPSLCHSDLPCGDFSAKDAPTAAERPAPHTDPASTEGADNCAHYSPADNTCMGKPHMDCYRCEDYTRRVGPSVNCKGCGTICNAVGTDTTMDTCCNFTPREPTGSRYFALPSIALDCTANAAWLKYLEECAEVDKAKNVLHSLIEQWDCIQALQTCIEKGGDKRGLYKDLIDAMEERRRRGLQVDLALRAMLIKNAARWRYSDKVNRLIIESNGNHWRSDA